MKKIISFLFILFSFFANAQKGTLITYKLDKRFYNEGGNSKIIFRFIFNDSFAFCYHTIEGEDTLYETKIFSKNIKHHAYFTDKIKMIRFAEVNFKTLGYNVDTVKIDEWKPISRTKRILGYVCKGVKNVSTKSGTTIIWYTTELGNGIGFTNLNFNLGIPLKVTLKKYNCHFKATIIEKGEYKFNLPKGEILKYQ